MTTRTANYTVTGLALGASLLTGVLILGWWLARDAAMELQVRLPGGDGRPADLDSGRGPIDLKGTFLTFAGEPADLPGEWTRFRGADFDNICEDAPSLKESWPETGPELLWDVDLGEGHAAPVVLDGRVYLLDYDEEERADAIRCLSLADGQEIWRRFYGVDIKRNHGLSRTVPAVTPDFLVTIGPRCHVVCLDSMTGDFLWGIDLKAEYGTTEPLWYTGQCPLIDDGLAILAPAGPDVLMMAVDCATGDVVWQAPNPKGWDMSHSSIMPMTLAGMKTFVYCAVGGLAGVLAEGEEAGSILWEVPWNAKVVAPSPVVLEENKVFMTAGYGAGGMMLQIHEDDGGFVGEVLYEYGPKDGLACEQQTPIYYKDLLYGIMPKDAGALKNQFVCYDVDGNLVWSSGPDHRFGLGPFLLADGKFLVLNDDGMLSMLRASTSEYIQLAQAPVLDGHDAWGPLVLVGNRLLLRDSKRMVCVELETED